MSSLRLVRGQLSRPGSWDRGRQSSASVSSLRLVRVQLSRPGSWDRERQSSPSVSSLRLVRGQLSRPGSWDRGRQSSASVSSLRLVRVQLSRPGSWDRGRQSSGGGCRIFMGLAAGWRAEIGRGSQRPSQRRSLWRPARGELYGAVQLAVPSAERASRDVRRWHR